MSGCLETSSVTEADELPVLFETGCFAHKFGIAFCSPPPLLTLDVLTDSAVNRN